MSSKKYTLKKGLSSTKKLKFSSTTRRFLLKTKKMLQIMQSEANNDLVWRQKRFTI